MLYVCVVALSSPLGKRLAACICSTYQLVERITLSICHDVDLFSFYVFVSRLEILHETGRCKWNGRKGFVFGLGLHLVFSAMQGL